MSVGLRVRFWFILGVQSLLVTGEMIEWSVNAAFSLSFPLRRVTFRLIWFSKSALEFRFFEPAIGG